MVENRRVLAAIVGHVEWAEFVRVEQLPGPDEIVTAEESWQEAGGGGGVAAAQLAELAGDTVMYTALGDDELGHRAKEQLESLGVRVEAVWRSPPQRRAVVFLDVAGERSITVIGERHHPRGRDPLPWAELTRADGVYFTAGDREALEHARDARALVVTARELTLLEHAQIRADAVVGSASDEKEQFVPSQIEPAPGLAVVTSGGLGGWSHPGGPFAAEPLPGPREDAYGCGDSFAAGLTFALGCGRPREAALELAARCGASALTRRGALGLPYA